MIVIVFPDSFFIRHFSFSIHCKRNTFKKRVWFDWVFRCHSFLIHLLFNCALIWWTLITVLKTKWSGHEVTRRSWNACLIAWFLQRPPASAKWWGKNSWNGWCKSGNKAGLKVYLIRPKRLDKPVAFSPVLPTYRFWLTNPGYIK